MAAYSHGATLGVGTQVVQIASKANGESKWEHGVVSHMNRSGVVWARIKARAVRAHRMSIPEAAGTVNPSKILKGERKVFDNLASILAPEDTPHPSGIRPCHLVKQRDERAILENLFDGLMLT